MLGKQRMGDAVGSARPYAERIAQDEELREHARNALESSQRVRGRLLGPQGATGIASRVARDKELQEELKRVVDELRQAGGRLRPKQSHRTRNRLLLTVGVVLGALFNPVNGSRLRSWLTSRLSGGGASAETPWSPPSTRTIEESIEVEVPLSTAYNQWTQFEEFPQFMEGVEEVKQLDDTLLRWAAKVGGKRQEWDATITEQRPDERVAWRSVDGKQNAGVVTFHRIGDSTTRVMLQLDYPPEGIAEQAGSALGLDRRRIRGDLERFKELIESRGVESGAWRGEVDAPETSAPATPDA